MMIPKAIEKILKNRKAVIIITCIFGILSILLGLILVMGYGQDSLRSFANGTYSIRYDGTWRASDSTETKIRFTHKTNSTLDFSIVDLKDADADKNLSELVDGVKYGIEKSNKSYKLINNQSKTVTKNNYEAYQMLYENESSESMIIVGKKDARIFIINYIADKNYFDILLDSAQNIISNFNLIDAPFKLNSEPKSITTSGIKYSTDSFGRDYSKTTSYEIYNNHYHVKYSIPSLFEISEFDTTSGVYSLSGERNDGDISVYTNVVYQNMNDYITDESRSGSLANTIKALKADTKTYSDILVENEDLGENIDGYIYKISYSQNSLVSKDKTQYETSYVIYKLDHLRTFVIEIKGRILKIPQGLIEKIKMDSFEKYGDNIDRTAKDGYLIDELKVIPVDISSSDKKYYSLQYSIPSSYVEIDNMANKFQNRYFGFDYDNENEEYKYEISTKLSKTGSEKSYVDDVNQQYSHESYENAKLVYGGMINSGSHIFKRYDGDYTIKDTNSVEHKIYLLFELSFGGLYSVEISSTYQEIPQEIIDVFLNIRVDEKTF